MDEARFDQTVRALGANLPRRGALATLAGLGLAALARPAAARTKKRRKGPLSRVAVASLEDSSLVLEGNSDATHISLIRFYEGSDVWRHTDLTVTVDAAGNADPAFVAVIHDAIAIWSRVLDDHFAGRVTLTDVTDKHHEAVKADMRVHFIPRRGGTHYSGLAICGDDHCDKIYVKSDFPPGSFGHKFGDPPEPTAEFVGHVALHELGHALGLDHAEDILTTNDIMGYGFLPWNMDYSGTPFLSTCDLKALDEIWAWAVEGAEPRRPSVPEVVCDTV